MSIDSTVASTSRFLIFFSFFALIRMLINFYWTNSQGAGCLHVVFLPMRRRTPRPFGLSIRKLSIRDSRGFGLAQAIRKVELGGLDIMSLKDKIRMEALSNNQRGYYVMYYAACPYRDGGAQGEDRLGSQDRPNRWGSEYTCFHGLNVVRCEIVWKVPDVEAG